MKKLDEPRYFSAYLHALKWTAVTASNATLFQAPFRAGIQLLNHQMVPLKKALALPRVNLFIADDVGLGKTIEAGLVLQELMATLGPRGYVIDPFRSLEYKFDQSGIVENLIELRGIRFFAGLCPNPHWRNRSCFPKPLRYFRI